MQIRVYYEDTDCGNMVYHSNYLKFCERARSEMFFTKGLIPHDSENFFVVKHIDASFIKSAKFADILEIKSTIVEKKNVSLKMEQKVFRNDELLFSMIVTLVNVKNGRPSKIPEELFEILSN